MVISNWTSLIRAKREAIADHSLKTPTDPKAAVVVEEGSKARYVFRVLPAVVQVKADLS
jgi:hypothetical protein